MEDQVFFLEVGVEQVVAWVALCGECGEMQSNQDQGDPDQVSPSYSCQREPVMCGSW